MTEKLRSCPFCGGEAKLQLTDDEGNFKDESYLENPYSGVGYVIQQTVAQLLLIPIVRKASTFTHQRKQR